jgi:hypothetical protein
MPDYTIAIIDGHEYKYRYNPETKLMDYLGPVGDAPLLTQEEFQERVNGSRWAVWIYDDYVLKVPKPGLVDKGEEIPTIVGMSFKLHKYVPESWMIVDGSGYPFGIIQRRIEGRQPTSLELFNLSQKLSGEGFVTPWDLHGDNVIVDDEGYAWVIDIDAFRYSKEAPPIDPSHVLTFEEVKSRLSDWPEEI